MGCEPTQNEAPKMWAALAWRAKSRALGGAESDSAGCQLWSTQGLQHWQLQCPCM